MDQSDDVVIAGNVYVAKNARERCMPPEGVLCYHHDN
jgi:hypothetical protein